MKDHIEAHDFIAVVRSPLEQGDACHLAEVVLAHWSPAAVAQLLGHNSVDVRRVAAVTLGLVGGQDQTPPLLKALHDPDLQVNQMAENALWGIWFRSGSAKTARPFHAGMAALQEEAYDAAIRQFRIALEIDPTFAEAYNQCAIAHFFLGEYEVSIRQCARAVHLLPAHFGAIGGIGHSYAQLNCFPQALHCYRQALSINPNMPTIALAAERLEDRLGDHGQDQGDPALDPISAAIRAIGR